MHYGGFTLDQLECGPDSVATVLDWGIKHALFRDRAARAGVPMERFAFLNVIERDLKSALAGAGVNGRIPRFDVLLGPKSPVPAEVARLGSALAEEGLAWSDLECFRGLRDEFCQIDTRFGQLGPRGIFTELDRLGVLNHKVEAVDEIEAAMSQPPAVGRAKLRGETIRRLCGQGRAGCNWTEILGPDGRMLDLSDPFAAAEVWTGLAAPGPDPGDSLFDFAPDEGDPGRFRQMLDAIRGRRGRTRSRDQGPPFLNS